MIFFRDFQFLVGNRQHIAAFFLAMCLLSPLFGRNVAAQEVLPQIYLDGAASVVSTGKYFDVRILLQAGNTKINAFHIDVSFNDLVELESIRDASTIVDVWIEKSIDKEMHMARLEGIIPGGFEGTLIPNSFERQPGHIAMLHFKAIGEGNAKISPENVRFYMHDGNGTEITAGGKEFVAFVTDAVRGPQTADVSDAICFGSESCGQDRETPEAFPIRIVDSPDAFNGKVAIAFEARDRETGISHYIIRESIRSLIISSPPSIKKIEKSPFVITYQRIPSVIEVTAVDFNGNERSERVYYPQNAIHWYEFQDVSVVVALLFFLFIFSTFKMFSKKTK